MPKCLTRTLEIFDTHDRQNLCICTVSLHAPQQSLVHVLQIISAFGASINALQLLQVMDDLETAGAAASLLPALKRRSSGKRNLHRPWTTVEEALLTRLVEQADYRKQVTCIRTNGCSKSAHRMLSVRRRHCFQRLSLGTHQFEACLPIDQHLAQFARFLR